jgi:leucyl-tRNA synthetase
VILIIDYKAIEQKWQKKWAEAKLGEAEVSDKPKFFMLFAYPGSSGFLHVGHMRGFCYTDMVCRYMRMTGHNVLFPVGTHATGNVTAGFVKKLNEKDPTVMEQLDYWGKKPEDVRDIKKAVEFFNENYQTIWRRFGFLVDWRRFTCTINPDYSKFIEWQFYKLKERGLLTQKPYYSGACPEHGPLAIDPSETDISKGGNAEKVEYTLLKFMTAERGVNLVAATLRPETIYGQTNLWVNPGAEYVEVRVGEEIWIISKESTGKLKLQKPDIEITNNIIIGKDLVGKYVNAPGIDKNIIVLPAKFVDPKVGTGIVTSVPSDAIKDYVALKEIQADERYIKSYGLDPKTVKAIKPIPIIKTKQYGDNAAEKVVQKLGIKSQEDPKLEEATNDIYKIGFHEGTMNENCDKYAGMPVSKAKDQVRDELIKKGKAVLFYDLSEEVICRCGKAVNIVLVPDQWFIKYSDKELKQKSKMHAQTMSIYPNDYKQNLPKAIDWFDDRACTRLGSWQGTKLPWDTRWVIEPIADSTLYPAYYVVSKFANSKRIKLEEMTLEFFDYVFLGKGNPKSGVWEDVRKEFKYFYPLDINLSGKEHQTVHFPVFIMNHVGIMEQKHWPSGIFVNYWVIEEKEKLSKSKGGVSSSPVLAADEFSVDGMRLYYAHVSSPFADMMWNEKVVRSYRGHVERFYSTIKKLYDLPDGEGPIDNWMISELHSSLKKYEEYMAENNLRKAVDTMLFGLMKNIDRYFRSGGRNAIVGKEIAMTWTKAMAPFIPHICEELWSEMGYNTFVSEENMSKWEKERLSSKEKLLVNFISNLENDIVNVKKLAGADAKELYIVLAEDSKWKKDIPIDKNMESKIIDSSMSHLKTLSGTSVVLVDPDKTTPAIDPNAFEKLKSKAKTEKPALYYV